MQLAGNWLVRCFLGVFNPTVALQELSEIVQVLQDLRASGEDAAALGSITLLGVVAEILSDGQQGHRVSHINCGAVYAQTEPLFAFTGASSPFS